MWKKLSKNFAKNCEKICNKLGKKIDQNFFKKLCKKMGQKIVHTTPVPTFLPENFSICKFYGCRYSKSDFTASQKLGPHIAPVQIKDSLSLDNITCSREYRWDSTPTAPTPLHPIPICFVILARYLFCNSTMEFTLWHFVFFDPSRNFSNTHEQRSKIKLKYLWKHKINF